VPVDLGEDAELIDALGVMAHSAVASSWRAPTHDEVHARLAALDRTDFTLRPRRHRVVVHELPLLELESRAG
jgi:hypothetical protein